MTCVVCRILGILFEAKIRISFPSFINLGNGTYFWPWIFFTLAFWRLRSYLKWSPITFGPLTFLVPKKFGPWEVWAQRNLLPAWNSLYSIFMQGPTFLGPKFLRDQISWGPKKSGAQMRSGTISVTASKGHNWPWKKTKKAEIFSRLACATTEAKLLWVCARIQQSTERHFKSSGTVCSSKRQHYG